MPQPESTALPKTVYKFSTFEGARGVLESGCLWTKSPFDFNDPFETLPYFDEARKNLHIRSRKEHYFKLGFPGAGDLVAGGGEENMPVEDWVDLAAKIHDPLFGKIHRRFRVLCFSKSPDPNLLWSHYADSHTGIAIGFDLSKGGFPRGIYPDGIHVTYREDRTGMTIPLDYYESNLREAVDPSPEGYSRTSGGILVSHKDTDAIYRDSLVRILSSKQSDWAYEQELRFLYDLRESKNNGLRESGETYSAQFDAESVVEVIVGYKCPIAQIRESAEILKERYPSARLKYVDLHPFKYEVTIRSGKLKQILTSHELRENHSFREHPRPVTADKPK